MSFQNLGTLWGYSDASAVSPEGEVSGVSDTPLGPHGFYWSASTGIVDIGVLVPSDPQGEYSTAWSVRKGIVVGEALLGSCSHASITSTAPPDLIQLNWKFRWNPAPRGI